MQSSALHHNINEVKKIQFLSKKKYRRHVLLKEKVKFDIFFFT